MNFSVRATKTAFASSFEQRIILLMSCCLIAACSGPGSGSGPQLTELSVLNASADRMINRFDQEGFSDPGMVPASGNAKYNGYFLAQLANADDNLTDSISGEMTIDVDFGSSAIISGTVFGLIDDNSEAMSGQLTLSGGSLNRNGDPEVDATLVFEGDGVLVDVNSNSIGLDLVFEGDFLGSDATGIGGSILGQATTDQGNQSVGGIFVTEAELGLHSSDAKALN